MENNRRLIMKLINLLRSNYDAVEGYKNAAQHVKDPQLKTLFSDHSQQRRQFAGDLTNEIEDLGEQPPRAGTFTGSMHRAWMDIKSAISANNDEMILEECIRGEKAALAEYNELMAETSDFESVKNLIALQKSIVTDYISELESLETERHPDQRK